MMQLYVSVRLEIGLKESLRSAVIFAKTRKPLNWNRSNFFFESLELLRNVILIDLQVVLRRALRRVFTLSIPKIWDLLL